MKQIRIRGSSLDTYPLCPRKFAAEWLLSAEPDMARDYGMRRPKQHIGAVVGTSVHTGVAFLMSELKSTGSHGGARRVKHAQAAGAAKLAELAQEPIMSDSTTKNATLGVKACGKIIERYHADVRPDSEPTIVEQGLSMIVIVPGWPHVEVTGTLDRYHILGGMLRDCKTGRTRPTAIGQQGSYSLNLRSNGFDVESVGLDYGKRVGEYQPQPPIEHMPIDRAQAERHAHHITQQAAGGLYRMIKTGDPECLIAAPAMNMLCSAKYCPAHGTEFCALGKLVNP